MLKSSTSLKEVYKQHEHFTWDVFGTFPISHYFCRPETKPYVLHAKPWMTNHNESIGQQFLCNISSQQYEAYPFICAYFRMLCRETFPYLLLWINNRIFCEFTWPIRCSYNYEFKVSWVHSEDNESTAAVQLWLPERGPVQAVQLPAKILGPEAHEREKQQWVHNEYTHTHRTSERRGAKKHTIIENIPI